MKFSGYHYNNPFFKNPLPCGGYLLLQTGEMYCDQDYIPQNHHQTCFELTYVVSGQGRATANNVDLPIKKDDCFISIDGDMHSVVSDKDDPLRFKFLAISTIDGNSTCEYVKHIYKYLNERRRINVPSLNKRFLRIFDELENGLIFSSEAIGMEITAILIDIIRAMEEKTQKRYPVKISNDNILVFYITNYIDNNVLKLKNLYELETAFNYSYNYMSAVFKKIMTTSLNDYFTSAKMNVAKKLLEEGLTVTEVSEKLAYSSVHTFSRSFKKFFGQSAQNLKVRKNVD